MINSILPRDVSYKYQLDVRYVGSDDDDDVQSFDIEDDSDDASSCASWDKSPSWDMLSPAT